jgi:hypothetical protein
MTIILPSPLNSFRTFVALNIFEAISLSPTNPEKTTTKYPTTYGRLEKSVF